MARGAVRGPATAPAAGRCCMSDQAADRDRALEAICAMLLRRYGVVFREVLTRESILPPWREVLGALRRLEDRGEVRGGRFVSDFLGEQFALPVAVESLRAMRQESAAGRNRHGFGGRSAEYGWHTGAGRTRCRQFRPLGNVPRRCRGHRQESRIAVMASLPAAI